MTYRTRSVIRAAIGCSCFAYILQIVIARALARGNLNLLPKSLGTSDTRVQAPYPTTLIETYGRKCQCIPFLREAKGACDGLPYDGLYSNSVFTRRALSITLLLPDVVIPLSKIPFDVTETGILYLWDWARVPLSFLIKLKYTFLRSEKRRTRPRNDCESM